MNEFGKKLVGLIDAALGRADVDPTIKLGQAIIKYAPAATPTPDEKARLLALQAEYVSAWQAANVIFTSDAARRAYHKQIGEQSKFSRSERLSTVRTRGEESLASEYRGKQLAAKKEMHLISAEASDIARPVIQRFVSAAEKFLAEQEARERREAAEFGLEWQPSAIVTAIRTLILPLKTCLTVHTFGSGAPKATLPFLNLDK